MTQHEALPEGEQNGGKPKMNKPVLSHRAREAAEKGNPFAEGLLGKILGDQVGTELTTPPPFSNSPRVSYG